MKTKVNIKLLGDLIAIQSVSSDQKKCSEVLQLFCSIAKVNMIPFTIGDVDGQPNLILGDIKTTKVMFLSHADVVPAKSSDFNLKIVGDKLFGRGVLDMKGPMLVGFEVFLETWSNGRRDVLFVVTTDEEIGGFLGAAKLLNKFRLIKLAIVLDGGSGEDVVVKQKAPFHIEITHLGKSAHASRPSEGVNSIHKLAECCLLICNKLECASITKIGGGEASNKIPDIAQAILDIRIKSKNLLQNAIKEISIATNEFGCSWMPIDKPVFFEVSAKNKFIKIFAKLSGRKFTCESGTSDARFLSDKQCIPTIVTSALGGNIHGNNEWVSWKSLIKLKDDIRNFINDLEVQL